jgi:hypothetical protein
MIRLRSALLLPLTKSLPSAAAGGITIMALAACSAGVTSPSATSAVPSKPVNGGSTVHLAAPLGSFPIPHGAGVLESVVAGTGSTIMLGNITAAAADSFYSAALPADGFVISEHDSASGGGASGMSMLFTGHGYKGEIATMSVAEPTGLASFAGMPSFPSLSDAFGTASDGTVVIALARQ